MGRQVGLIVFCLLLGSTALASSPPTTGQQYEWNGPDGQIHFSDVLTTEAIASGYEIVAPSGLVIKTVPRPPTSAEIQAAVAAAAASKQAAATAAEAKQKDATLLANYPTEAALLQAQTSRLTLAEEDMRSSQAELKHQQLLLGNTLKDLANGQGNAAALKKRLSMSRQNVTTAEATVTEAKAAVARTQQSQAEELHLYQSLKKTGGSSDGSH